MTDDRNTQKSGSQTLAGEFEAAPFFKSLLTGRIGDISLKQRIILVFVTGIIIFAVCSFKVFENFSNYTKQESCLKQITVSINSINAELLAHRIDKAPEEIENLNIILNAQNNADILSSNEFNRRFKAKVSEFLGQAKNLLRSDLNSKSSEQTLNNIFECSFEISQMLKKSELTQSAYKRVVTTLILAILITGLYFGLMAVLLSKSINGEVRHVFKSLKRLAAGDLRKSGKTLKHKNELGAIDALVELVSERMLKTVNKLNSDFTTMVDMVNNNSNILDNTADAMANQTEKANSVAIATSDMENNIDKVTEFAKSTLTEVQTAEKASNTCRCTMQDNITTTHTLSDRLRDTSVAISRINEMGEQINAIVKTIAAIADQTNLLALNATIEAARTGEHGKGFAVVADEIRTLATKTAVSTKEVADTISNLTFAVKKCVDVVASCETEMDNSMHQSSRANSAIEEIMGIIATITDMSEQIVSSCQHQSDLAADVNQAISNINNITAECYEHINDTKTSVHEIRGLAQNQVENLSTFKIETPKLFK